MKRNIVAAALSLLLVSLLAGCSIPASSGDATAAEADTESEQSYDFVFVCPIVGSNYWADCIAGIKKADEELGTTTRVVGPRKGSDFAVEIINYMKDAIASQPDGILAYAGIEGLFPLINEAAEKDIPVISINSDAPDTDRVAYVGTDLYNFGYEAGKTLVDLTGGKAKIGYLCSVFSAENEKETFDAFQDAINDYDMEVVAKGEGGTEASQGAKQARRMLAQHPEITAFFCTASYTVTGAARVKEEQGLKDLVLVGVDDIEENLDLVRKGTINALLVQSPYNMGYQGVHLLKKYLDDGMLQKDAYDTGSTLVTKANVDSYKE